MAKRSPVFIAANAVLILLNIALIGAVIYQRNNAAMAQQRTILENANARLDARLNLVKEIEDGYADLESRHQTLKNRVEQLSPRFYDSAKRAPFQEELTDMIEGLKAGGSTLQLVKFSQSISDQTPPLKEHLFTVRMKGRMTLLPALSKALFELPVLCLQTRYGAISPDFTYRNLDMVADFKCYEYDPQSADRPSSEQIINTFTIGQAAVNDPQSDELLALHESAQKKDKTLKGKYQLLTTAGEMEADIRVYETLLAQMDDKSAQFSTNKTLVTENLSKLYRRVRNSGVGGAALIVDGDAITFPDYSGE